MSPAVVELLLAAIESNDATSVSKSVVEVIVVLLFSILVINCVVSATNTSVVVVVGGITIDVADEVCGAAIIVRDVDEMLSIGDKLNNAVESLHSETAELLLAW